MLSFGSSESVKAAVDDGAAERASPSPFDIDVDPLQVTGQFGEAIYIVPLQREPPAGPERASDVRRQIPSIDRQRHALGNSERSSADSLTCAWRGSSLVIRRSCTSVSGSAMQSASRTTR